jgi:predicted nucleic-acid-binding Zn-ribbon protein
MAHENTNILAGIACPRCGQTDRFEIIGTSIFHVTDDGAEQVGDIEWDDYSACQCPVCRYKEMLGMFQGKHPA